MRFDFLGPGRVLAADGSVVLQGGLPLTFLAFLALHPEGVLREDLAVLFWPGRERELALQSLRQTLTRLRRAVGPDGVIREGNRIRLNTADIQIDVVVFEDTIAQGNLIEAVRLWRGGFLPDVRNVEGWELEAWLDRERGRLRARLQSALVECATRQLNPPDEADPSAKTFPPEVLDALDQGFRFFPDEEELLLLRLDLALARGQVPEATALLEEVRPCASDSEVALRENALVALAHLDRVFDPGSLGRLAQRPSRPHRRWAAALVLFLPLFLGGLAALSAASVDRGLANHFLVFCSTMGTFRSPGNVTQLFRMDLDGRNKQRLSAIPGCSSVWLEGAEMAVFVPAALAPRALTRLRPQENPITEWIAEPLSFPQDVTALYPEFHGELPQIDGRYAIITGEVAPGEWRLFAVDPLADSVWLLTADSGQHQQPAWDPDTREVIYASNRGGTVSLWAMDPFNPDAPPTQLTDSPSEDKRATVRNGRVLFVRGFGTGPTEGDYEIRMLDRNTGVEEVLVSRPWNDFMARWSPDGKHLCWTSEEFGHFESDIWVMDLATRRMRNLTADLPGRNYEYKWRPDSRTVFFASVSTGRTQIYRVTRTGRWLKNISRSAAEAEPWDVLNRDILTAGQRSEQR